MNKQVQFVFANSIYPPGARMGHQSKELFGGPKPFSSPFVYFQTTDADGFVYKYGECDWLSETVCNFTVQSLLPTAIQATCHVEGFGQVMCRADNEGRLYDQKHWRNGETVLFDVEAAKSEIAFCRRRIDLYREQGYSIDAEIILKLGEAVELLKIALAESEQQERLRKANLSLGQALYASEYLELSRANLRLAGLGKRPFSFSAFCDGNFEPFEPRRNDRVFAERYKSVFNGGAVSMFWNKSQPNGPHEFDWRYSDEQFSWIEEHGLAGIGHCLGWLQLLPDWLKHVQSVEELIPHLIHLTDATVERYGHIVELWTPLNELHDWFHEIEMPLEDRVTAFKAVVDRLAQIHPQAAVESDSCLITSPWRMVKPEWETGPLEWFKALEYAGVKNFVIGIQLYHGGGPYATFDMGRITQQLEFYCGLGHPVHLYAQTPGGSDLNHMLPVNGAWHGAWCEENQADWWEQLLTIAISFPQIRGITAVTLADTNPNWSESGGLCTADLQSKSVMRRISGVLNQYTDRYAKAEWRL